MKGNVLWLWIQIVLLPVSEVVWQTYWKFIATSLPHPEHQARFKRNAKKRFFFYFFVISKTKSEAEGVIIPGDPEQKHMEKCDQLGGIPYHRNVVDHINSVAKNYAVKTLSFS